MYKQLDVRQENIVAYQLSGNITSEKLDEFADKLEEHFDLTKSVNLLLELKDFDEWDVRKSFSLSRFLLSQNNKLSRIAFVTVTNDDDLKVIEQLIPFLSGVEIERFDNVENAKKWLKENEGSDHWTVDPTRYRGEARSPKDLRILIVGAGIAGLTLASMLQQRDMSPEVVEDAEEFGKIGYVIILMSAGARILKGLGVYHQLGERGVLVHKYDIASTDGEILRSHKVTETYSPLFGNCYSIYRPALVDVIKRSMKDDSVIRMGTTVRNIEQTNDEVTVTFTDGTEGTYDLVVGADGLHSKVRELTFGQVEMIYSGLHGWAWWGDLDDEFSHRALEYWGTGGAFGIYSTADRLCLVGVAEIDASLPDEPHDRKERILKHFSDWKGHVPHGLDELKTMDVNEIFHDDFYYGDQEHWYKGRVVLAGDSVHAFSPISGMGASMAIESAAVLAEELCYVDSRFIDQALRKYQERRQPRANMLRKQARAFGDVVTAENAVFTGIRNVGVRHIADGPLHHFLARIPYEPV